MFEVFDLTLSNIEYRISNIEYIEYFEYRIVRISNTSKLFDHRILRHIEYFDPSSVRISSRISISGVRNFEISNSRTSTPLHPPKPYVAPVSTQKWFLLGHQSPPRYVQIMPKIEPLNNYGNYTPKKLNDRNRGIHPAENF